MPRKTFASKFGKSKLTLREVQASIRSQAPSGWDNSQSKFPMDFLDKTPQSPRNVPNKKEEKRFMDALFLTCAQYYKTGLKRIWLKKNSNGTARTFDGQSVIKYGLGAGVSDGIGYRVLIITPEMIGKPFAQFLAIEGKLKSGGVVSYAQQQFIDQVNKDGGLAFVAYDTDGVQQTINRVIL